MPTAAQKKARASELRRELERDRKRKDREALRLLRERLRHAKQLRRAQLREVQLLCKRGRVAARERAKAIRAEHRALAALAIDKARAEARSTCTARQTKARSKGGSSVSRALAALELERTHQAHMRRYEKPARLGAGTKPKRQRAESISESDSEVANDLPEDLLPVWRKVKAKIKGSPRRTRTEAFFEWVAEHQGEVQRIMHAQFERDVERMIAEEEQLRERLGDPSIYRRMSDRQLAEVPF